ASRLGLRGHDGGYGFAQFGVEVLCGDLGFSDRVHRRVDDDNTEDGIFVVGAVQLIGDAAEGLAVDLNLLGSLRVFIRGVRENEDLCPGPQKLKVCEVVISHREVGILFLIENGRYIGAFRLQLRQGIGIDLNRHFRAAYVERRINAGGGVGFDLNSFGLKGLEALERDFKVVDVRDQVGNAIVARTVR